MFRLSLRACCLAVLLALLCYSDDVAARGRRIWTYKDLVAESEVVCIGTVQLTDKRENTEFFPEDLDRFESKIRVVAILKGDAKLKDLVFVHFKYRTDINTTLGNGPSFPDLDDPKPKAGADPIDAAINKRRAAFLFFLRRRADGAYEPITGNHVAKMSVARVNGFADEE